MHEVAMNIQGLGFVLYSPSALSHVQQGSDYLQEHFTRPSDIARHVMEGEITTFCTGSPGFFKLLFKIGVPDEEALQASEYKLRLGLHVHDSAVFVRDVYDLMEWNADCPQDQQLSVEDGWYRLTVVSSPPATAVLGDGQEIEIFLERVDNRPLLRWEGCPCLC